MHLLKDDDKLHIYSDPGMKE